MAQRYANLWSDAAAGLTATAHTRASIVRWGFVLGLTFVWLGGGLAHWLKQDADLSDALYRTLGAVAMWDPYFEANNNLILHVVRFAALAVPVVGLLFAFSGQLGRALARVFNLGAARHVVIAGDGAPALSLALDCRKRGDAVMLIARALAEETALDLRRKGVIVLEGNAAHLETLRAARAHHAAHVVAFEQDDTANLQIEAAVRRLVGDAKRRRPIGVHVATRAPLLLREAREMRSLQARGKEKASTPAIDSKPFSLEEIAARALLQQESQTLLHVAKQLGQARVHLVCFGFDVAAEALIERVFSSLWSVHFEAPRVTVLTPNPQSAEAGFRARHREAFAHPELWSADIAFLPFDWNAASIGAEVFEAVESAYGKPSAAVVATGGDPGNIHLAIALLRACNSGRRWPIPIYMYETAQSEFSLQYARGDLTPGFDAYLLAFGAHQGVATRKRVIDGALDQGAAIAHEHYSKNLAARDPMSMRELQAAMKGWADVRETYRAANRAVADAAMVMMWDAGWRAAPKGEKGEQQPTIPDDLVQRLAQREHDRWMAERLVSGWRPTAQGEDRDNDLMAHDKLAPWSAMDEADRLNDEVQVRAGVDIARLTHPNGFLRR